MTSLRICFFNRSYYPDTGATGQLLAELAEDLVHEHGCEISVVAGPSLPKGEGGSRASGWALVRRESRGGVRVFRCRGTTFRPERFAGRTANYLSYFASAWLASVCVPRPDVVVSLTDPPIIGLAALITARRCGARFVFLCQDVFPEVAGLLEDFRNETVNRLLDRISRLLIRKADRVVAVGETMRERLVEGKGADPRKVVVIHNWADCSAVVPGPKRNAFAVTHGLADAFVVMHSGNVGLSQDLDTLLDAADRLRSVPDLLVAIIGDGARRRALEARVRSLDLANVRFFPYQHKEDLKDSFASADVFVVSLKRGLAGYIVPSKLYGILAAGRPYVAAVDEGSEVAAITDKYGSGLLVEPGKADDLAEKILTLHRDRALARRLGANGRQAALEFDRPLQVQAYHRLFRDLCAARVAEPHPPLLKRPFDMLLSGAGLLLSAPLWALIALAIKLDDGGPVFYTQERVGKDGKRFRSLKFRSMIEESDARFGPLQARDRDPRVTRVGRILRTAALDELPQLWSILKGDMSFVGPRPLLPAEVEAGASGEPIPIERIPGHAERVRMTPGLTGVAQIFADRDIPRRHKFKLDRLYMRRQSFWLDLKLIALSFWITFRGKWEHRGRKV